MSVHFKNSAVRLRSRVGAVEFTRRTMIQHETGNYYLTPVTFRFDDTNGFTSAVPKDVWHELEYEMLDNGPHKLRYCDALLPV